MDSTYENCREIYLDKGEWREEKFRSELHSIEDISQTIKKLNVWKKLVQNSIKDISKGIVKVDGTKIKGILQSHINERIDATKKLFNN